MSAAPPTSRTIAIASGKGGVGKSFLALNLAWYLGELGQRVLLVELDADAGALSIAAGLGEKPARPALDAAALAQRAVALPGNPRVKLLRASDIATQIARSPAALEPLLAQLPAQWRIVDLAPGMAAQNILWLRRASLSWLIGSPELVCVQAMLRLHMQLRRQHAYDFLCAREPKLRGGPPSLNAVRERMSLLMDTAAAEDLWRTAFASYQSSGWIFNRVLPDDGAQLARIAEHVRRHASVEAARFRVIPEDSAQARCARFGRTLMAADPSSAAAQAVRKLADELLQSASTDKRTVRIVARESAA